MNIYMPTLVYSERNCIKNHSKEFAGYGKKAMIVTGKHSSKENGSLKAVQCALENEGISYNIYSDIEENPSIDTIMKARKYGLDYGVDFVIGIGGGSPMDASKAIALMIANPDSSEEILYNPTGEEMPALDCVEVPTTAGTGSEVTPYAILTIHEKKTKKSIAHRIYPKLALLDSEYLLSVPREGMVNTAVDTLAHLLESYLNTNSNRFNQVYSREGMNLWGQIKDKLVENKLEREDYDILLEASCLAGMAITHTGTSLPHGLSYCITYNLGIPHGKAVGIYLAGFVKNYKDNDERNEALDLLGFKDADAFVVFMKKLLGEVKVDKTMLEENADLILSNAEKLKNYPFEINKKEIIEMKL